MDSLKGDLPRVSSGILTIRTVANVPENADERKNLGKEGEFNDKTTDKPVFDGQHGRIPKYSFDCVSCGKHVESRALFRPYTRQNQIYHCSDCVENSNRNCRVNDGENENPKSQKTEKNEKSPSSSEIESEKNRDFNSNLGLCVAPNCPSAFFPHFHYTRPKNS